MTVILAPAVLGLWTPLKEAAMSGRCESADGPLASSIGHKLVSPARKANWSLGIWEGLLCTETLAKDMNNLKTLIIIKCLEAARQLNLFFCLGKTFLM